MAPGEVVIVSDEEWIETRAWECLQSILSSGNIGAQDAAKLAFDVVQAYWSESLARRPKPVASIDDAIATIAKAGAVMAGSANHVLDVRESNLANQTYDKRTADERTSPLLGPNRIAWCGRQIEGWHFLDVDHALNTIRTGSGISACKKCLAAVRKVLADEVL